MDMTIKKMEKPMTKTTEDPEDTSSRVYIFI